MSLTNARASATAGAKGTALVARPTPAPTATSAAMREVLEAAEDVATTNTTVLLLGESGTGKEIVARHIHRSSLRAAGPWVAVNCAALPAELLESELFGHERGAFTGAGERRIGRIEQAHRGTLLLDEVSELPLPLQAKLLRVLQEREVDRVGGSRPIPVDVRVIATSNRDLARMVARKEFRTDLFYRLSVFPIRLPALRERAEDIPALADELLHAMAAGLGREVPALDADALAALSSYEFPGNVRELGNILERALVRCRSASIELRNLELPRASEAGPDGDVPPGGADANTDGAQAAAAGEDLGDAREASSLEDGAAALTASEVARPGDPAFPEGMPVDLPTLERLAIGEALRREGGNRTHAARILGISLRTLRNKLREYRDTWPEGEAMNRANAAARQALPGNGDRDDDARVRSATLARPSQRSKTTRAA